MAVSSTLTKRAVAMQLNNGLKDGKVQTVSVSLGNLTTGEGYTDQKAYNIVSVAEQVLSKSLVKIQKVETSTIANEE
ncbi:MAG: hypothetical protein IJP91_09070 [Synergistaceae bacterium]|nr:hypothetical protein [Synergistaceae bacterium]